MIHICIAAKVIPKIHKNARKVFPLENYSVLIGHKIHDGFWIEDAWFPSDLAKHSTEYWVVQPMHWIEQANEFALERYDSALSVIGATHSHPWKWRDHKGNLESCIRDIAPSVGDYEYPWKNIQGITSIIETKPGKLRTATRFFGPVTPVQVTRYGTASGS